MRRKKFSVEVWPSLVRIFILDALTFYSRPALMQKAPFKANVPLSLVPISAQHIPGVAAASAQWCTVREGFSIHVIYLKTGRM